MYGIAHGGDRKSEDVKIKATIGRLDSDNKNKKTPQEELAEQLNIDVKTLQRAKTLASLPPEIQDLVENESIKPSTASRLIAKVTIQLLQQNNQNQIYGKSSYNQYILFLLWYIII